jgi:hypothetical protein
MHEAYWLWQASVLPWANAPEAPITSDDVNNRKAVFMDAPDGRMALAGNLRPPRAVCI